MTRQKNKPRPRTYARNRAVSRRGYEVIFENDGTYLLKLVLCVLLGMFWIKFSSPITAGPFIFGAIPIGAMIGLPLVHVVEKHQANRKIWYAVLVIVTIISFFYPSGLAL